MYQKNNKKPIRMASKKEMYESLGQIVNVLKSLSMSQIIILSHTCLEIVLKFF